MRSSNGRKSENISPHWRSGIVEEEAQIGTEYHIPTIQLLKFTDGEAKGTYEIRFCHYNHQGAFQRSPLIIDEKDIPKLRKSLEATPKFKNMLKKLLY